MKINIHIDDCPLMSDFVNFGTLHKGEPDKFGVVVLELTETADPHLRLTLKVDRKPLEEAAKAGISFFGHGGSYIFAATDGRLEESAVNEEGHVLTAVPRHWLMPQGVRSKEFRLKILEKPWHFYEFEARAKSDTRRVPHLRF